MGDNAQVRAVSDRVRIAGDKAPNLREAQSPVRNPLKLTRKILALALI
jgi:hypothetical protein